MYAGQTMVNNNNVEVLLFPIDVMYITQGEYGSLSHTLAMDFVGWNNGQVYEYPYYAPCTLNCIAKNYSNGQAYLIYQSVNEVLKADGTIGIITLCVMHDNNPPYNVGDTVKQGELLGHTGTSGYVTGDHTHFNLADGPYVGWTDLGNGFSELTNSMHLYDGFYVNDTNLVNDYGYDWKTYEGQIGPDEPTEDNTKKKHKYKIFLYKRKNKLRR